MNTASYRIVERNQGLSIRSETMFPPGTHLAVERRLTVGGVNTGLRYWHHGIASAKDSVVDFGGGDPLDKGATSVRLVAFDEFRDGANVRAIDHPITHSGRTYSNALPEAEVVDRAMWLCVNQPPAYRLGYRNCESIAIWCTSGDYETFQVKRFLGWKAAAVGPATIYLLGRKAQIGVPIAFGSALVTLLTSVPYVHSRAFFNHTLGYPGVGNWERA